MPHHRALTMPPIHMYRIYICIAFVLFFISKGVQQIPRDFGFRFLSNTSRCKSLCVWSCSRTKNIREPRQVAHTSCPSVSAFPRSHESTTGGTKVLPYHENKASAVQVKVNQGEAHHHSTRASVGGENNWSCVVYRCCNIGRKNSSR